MVLDDVDFFTTQLADDRLDAHAFHADAGADRVHVFVFRHDGNFRALASFAGDGADDDGAVINFGDFGLEQVLNEIGHGAGYDDARTFGSTLDASDDDAHALADGERFQARLFLTRHAGFGLAEIEDHVRTFDALHGRVDDFAYASDVVVVNGVAFGLADFLKNYLLGKLRSDAAENSLGDLGNSQLSTDLDGGIDFARVIDRDLEIGIFDLFRSFHDGLYGEGVDLAGFLVELGAEIFLRLVVFAGGDDDGVFHRTHYDLRINPFFPAQRVDSVVELTCHK